MQKGDLADHTQPGQAPDYVPSAAVQISLLCSVADAACSQVAYFAAPDLRCLFANERYAKACGQPSGKALLGQTLQEILAPPVWQGNRYHIEQCLAGVPQHYSLPTPGSRGDTRMLEMHLAPHVEGHVVLGVFLLVSDMTDSWRAKQAARASQERLDKFNAASEEIIIFHHNGTILDANQATERITGYSAQSLRGRSIFDLIHPDDQALSMEYFRQSYENLYEATMVGSNGRCIDLEITGKNLLQADGTTQRIVVARDISVRKQAQAQAVFMTEHDLLTGLPNRQHLLRHTEQTLHRLAEQQRQAALLFINLDHFKTLNDSLGYFAGDEVLQAIALRLKASIGAEDFVARLGSDEFVVLLTQVSNRQEAKAVAEKLLLSIHAPHALAGMPISLTPSIGISLFPEHGHKCEELLRQANQAMLVAKENGGANTQVYAPSMDGSIPYEELVLERQLRQAIEHNQLVLHYQPQLCLKTNTLAGFEALVRWNHPQRGLIGPDKFIAFAEKRRLISGIGRWVLFEACRQLKAWHDAGLPKVPVAVNISPLELRQRDVLADIELALKTTGLAAQYLEIEITESILIQQSSPEHNVLNALRAQGVHIAIDDFGTGYSSLAYLKRYPIDKLKIDRSFITDTPHNVDDVAIVTAIIQMGHSLQLKVLAEGIEQEAQQALLGSLGCDFIQGFGLSRPLPAHLVQTWWQGWAAQPPPA